MLGFNRIRESNNGRVEITLSYNLTNTKMKYRYNKKILEENRQMRVKISKLSRSLLETSNEYRRFLDSFANALLKKQLEIEKLKGLIKDSKGERQWEK